MSKVIILGDTHLGAKSGSNHFSQHTNVFFEKCLYPYMKKNKIKTIFQLGDLFDNRTNLSYKAFHACKNTWFNPLVENDWQMYVLLGNHDIYHKNTLSINSPELLLGQYASNVKVFRDPGTVKIAGKSFDLIPWICAENEVSVFEFMNRKDHGSICLGHFEISGFAMYRGQESKEGIDPVVFEPYEQVLSGHYHHKSSHGTITYVGTPYEITWNDFADPRGFHVYDTTRNTLEFVQNPYTMFGRILYNNGWSGDLATMKDKIVKLVVQEKKDLYDFDRFVDSVKLAGIHELTIIENLDEFASGEIDEKIDLEDSSAIIDAYIDSVTTKFDKDKIKTYMRSLYNEALSL